MLSTSKNKEGRKNKNKPLSRVEFGRDIIIRPHNSILNSSSYQKPTKIFKKHNILLGHKRISREISETMKDEVVSQESMNTKILGK